MNAAGHRSVVYLHESREVRKSLYTRADEVIERIKRSWWVHGDLDKPLIMRNRRYTCSVYSWEAVNRKWNGTWVEGAGEHALVVKENALLNNVQRLFLWQGYTFTKALCRPCLHKRSTVLWWYIKPVVCLHYYMLINGPLCLCTDSLGGPLGFCGCFSAPLCCLRYIWQL